LREGLNFDVELLTNPNFQSKLETVKFQVVSGNVDDTSSFVMMLRCLCNANTVEALVLNVSIGAVVCDMLEEWIRINGRHLKDVTLCTLFEKDQRFKKRQNTLLQTLSTVCIDLECLHLADFNSLERETIFKVFCYGGWKHLQVLKLEGMRISDILHALCTAKNKYPISTISIYHCYFVSSASLSALLDSFQLKNFELIDHDQNYDEKEGESIKSDKVGIMGFMQKLMTHCNTQGLISLDIYIPQVQSTFKSSSDEAEILQHWHFPFPQLQNLRVCLSLRINPLVMSVLYLRINQNCRKLLELDFENSEIGQLNSLI